MEEFFDTHNYIAYPETIVKLARELIKVVDDYTSRKITNEDLRKVILFYADNSPDKLFNGSDYNITIKRKIGVKRLRIIESLLNGYQHRLR
ncbi:TIGR04540 family protein [Senegalia sp. (in: firmicutes)]|uniref:TIGR04540 family protein n=1 Tax=Senegalia sp. (in: firmicutes) TaxID=1924098 RepID=UPI003F98643F